ncbi:STAS domain-containing protein, partial [Domibacillus tundrae]
NNIDTFVANQLFQLTQSLQLLGVETVLSGIRPEVAQTAIHLGLNFSQIKTFHGLPQALVHLGFGK